jgi:Domain of unknown function (DUF4422)
MSDIALFSINYENERHKPSPQPEGGLVRAFVAGKDDEVILPARFADMRCQYHAWRHCQDYDIIGFHGYRKHIDFFGGELKWHNISSSAFRAYQQRLTKWNGDSLRNIMKHHKVVVTPPFHVGCGMAEDFRRSRSAADWKALEEIMGPGFDYDTPEIHGTFWVMQKRTFQEFMEFWWGVVVQLVPRLGTDDNPQQDYRGRDVAFLSERIASLWIQKHTETLKPVEMPLLISWDIT